MMQIRYPNITGKTPEERQDQMERFMRSMIDQLNLSMKSGEVTQTSPDSQKQKQSENPYSKQIKYLEETVAKLRKEVAASLDKNHPVGSIYCSEDPTEPEKLFGGTWERIRDKFILAAGSAYSAGSTGGAASHKLTVDEMPSHTHDVKRYTSGGELTGNALETAVAVTGTIDHAYGAMATGGGAAHNNMPPYLAMYIWKRIA